MPSRVKVSPQSGDKKLVLCIDDHKQNLHLRKVILQTAGYNVITATSGRMGLRLLERHPVHLVILDYRMPGMSGEAVAREIRRATPHVPILMLSGHIDVPGSVSSAVDVFVTKEQPPEVWLRYLTVLSEDGREIIRLPPQHEHQCSSVSRHHAHIHKRCTCPDVPDL
jgi:CheY-like chemotaxis protein